MRALAGPGNASPVRALRVAGRLPKAVQGHQRHIAALCEVAQMLSDRLGMPASVRALFVHLAERWDGKGEPARLRGEQIPLAMRIIHVARDVAFQRPLGGEELAASVVGARAGGAFDPAIATRLADEAADILARDDSRSSWDDTLDRGSTSPPRLTLHGGAIDRALAAMGDFADLASPYLVGHSAGVAELAGAAAQRCGFAAADVVAMRRAALVHDVGRVAVPTFLATLAPVATSHHERLDGTGYHRGVTAAALSEPARLLAAIDAYQAMTEPRPYREAHSPQRAAEILGREAGAGRLDANSVTAVLEAAGHRVPRIARPAGLTEREAQVIALLARGLQTKQIGRGLGISTKTADHHVQNAYAKIGVSTRAAAALFAMEHGHVRWGEHPIGSGGGRA